MGVLLITGFVNIVSLPKMLQILVIDLSNIDFPLISIIGVVAPLVSIYLSVLIDFLIFYYYCLFI